MYKHAEKTFPNYEFGKGQYAFYPHETISFQQKKLSLSELPKFHKAGPLQTGSNASRQTNHFKSQTSFLRVLGMNPFKYGQSFIG